MEALARVGSTADGLTVNEARRRLGEGGPNELKQGEQTGYFEVLLGQVRSFIVWLLIAAAAVSGVLGEWVEALAIAAIVVFNALISAWQEYSVSPRSSR